jgi:hypothetical protein
MTCLRKVASNNILASLNEENQDIKFKNPHKHVNVAKYYKKRDKTLSRLHVSSNTEDEYIFNILSWNSIDKQDINNAWNMFEDMYMYSHV